MEQYKNIQRPSLVGVPQTAILVVPSDSEDLPRTAKGLRIVNTTTGMQVITLITALGDEVSFVIPPQSLIYEELLVKSVKATGTGILSIHAYLD